MPVRAATPDAPSIAARSPALRRRRSFAGTRYAASTPGDRYAEPVLGHPLVYSRLQPSTAVYSPVAFARPEPSGCSRGRSELLICPRRPSNLVRILAARTQPDHLKRFFALFGTRSSFRKNPVPALARKTHFLVQNFSNFKILTKYDGYRHPPERSQRACTMPDGTHKLGVEEFSQASWDPQRMRE